jgi:hypothetical protein
MKKCYGLTDASIEEKKYGLPLEVITAKRKHLQDIHNLFLQEWQRLYQAGQSEESILQALEPRRIEFKIKPELFVKWCQEAKGDFTWTIVAEEPPPAPDPQSPILAGPTLSEGPVLKEQSPLESTPPEHLSLTEAPQLPISVSPISSEGPVVKEQVSLEPTLPDPGEPEVIDPPPSVGHRDRPLFPFPARVRWYIYLPMGITVILLGLFFAYKDRQLLMKEQYDQEEIVRFDQDLQRWKNLAQKLRDKDYMGVLKDPLPQDQRLAKKPQQWVSKAQAEDNKAKQHFQEAEKTRKKGDVTAVTASIKQLKQVPKHTTAYDPAQESLNEIEHLAKTNLASAQKLEKQDKLSEAIESLEQIPNGTQVFPQALKLRDLIESKIARQPAPEPLSASPVRQDVEPAPLHEPEGDRHYTEPVPEPAYQSPAQESHPPAATPYIEPAPTHHVPPPEPSGGGSGDRDSSGKGGMGG